MHQRSAIPAWLATAIALASCHTSYHAFEIADSCGCRPDQYCRVAPSDASRAAARSAESGMATECLPMPTTCSDPPTCACLGRPQDACREELGRFWVFERRPVATCDRCSNEEYCLTADAHGRSDATPAHLCGLLPPQCEDQSSCDCLTRHTQPASGHFACDDHSGRVEVSLLPSP
jgi:hypothetical protein